jgi:hypothetical protein
MTYKNLPINEPMINAYPYHGHLHSILSTIEESLPWIYCNYIQLITYDINWNDRPWFDFYTVDTPNVFNYNPWLKDNVVNIKTHFLLEKNIVEQCIESIDSGFYITIVLDDFYIPTHPNYHISHSWHEYLISGYNLAKKTFQLSGNLENFKYSVEELDFNNLEKAFKKEELINISLVKIDKDTNIFDFNVNEVTMLLEEFLLSKDTSERYRMFETKSKDQGKAKYYGIETYQYLIEHLENSIIRQNPIDLRAFYIIWEHKKIMVNRIIYMQRLNLVESPSQYLNVYIEFDKTAQKMLNLALKYNITRKIDILTTLIIQLKGLILEESNIVEKMLMTLSKNR